MKTLGLAALLSCVATVSVDARADDTQRQAEPAWSWAASTESPGPAPDVLAPWDSELASHCGVLETGLRTVAKRLVERKTRGLPYLDLDGLTFAQRVAGEPHVWPRAWIVSGRDLDHEATLKKLDLWRQSFHDVGERRCGIATGRAADGTEIVAAIALDALADLSTLPVRARTGAWLTIDARMLVPSTGARVVVLSPGSAPRNVPTSFERDRVRARFALDRPGGFTVQVLADVATGPRPVLEAQIFADVEPPIDTPDLAAPGEGAAAGSTGAPALMRMIQALRSSASLPPIARDARLDAVAMAHARRMMAVHTVGHDVGDGDPSKRLEEAGLNAKEAGENVAHAQSVQLAHRALYASPSHRANLLRAEFAQAGLAVIEDPDGSVWVVEVFAARLE